VIPWLFEVLWCKQKPIPGRVLISDLSLFERQFGRTDNSGLWVQDLQVFIFLFSIANFLFEHRLSGHPFRGTLLVELSMPRIMTLIGSFYFKNSNWPLAFGPSQNKEPNGICPSRHANVVRQLTLSVLLFKRTRCSPARSSRPSLGRPY
jgi:hypothetical protein